MGIAHAVVVPHLDGFRAGWSASAPVARTAERTIQVTSTVQDPIGLLRDSLEEQFQRNTDQLAELTLRARQPDRGGYDDDTPAALIASTRQAMSDPAQALRRMARGSYGTCEPDWSPQPAPVASRAAQSRRSGRHRDDRRVAADRRHRRPPVCSLLERIGVW